MLDSDNFTVKVNGSTLIPQTTVIEITDIHAGYALNDITLNDSYDIDDLSDFYIETNSDGTFYVYLNGSILVSATSIIELNTNKAPVLDGQTSFVTTVDDPITESEIRSYISAYDETDGDVTHLITLEQDNYTANKSTLGTYDLVYSVTDSGGNTTTLTVSIIVKDVLAPTWNTSKQNVTVSYTATFDIEAYKSQLGALDNYDASGNIAISIDANTYTASKTIPGTYQVVYALEDLSGNSSLAEVNVTVIDDVKPTFSGATTISKPLSTTMTITQIKSQITANDAIDGNLTASIQVVSDDYTGNGNRFGDYDVQFSVTDNSGNIAYHTITVSVIDDIAPIFYVRDGYFVAVDQVVSLTQQDFIDILVATGQITVSGSGTVEIYQLLNEYEGNEATPGIYALSFQVVTQSGNESIYNMAVEVLESTDDPVDVIEDNSDFDLTVFWNTNKTYIIGGLILLLFVGLGIVVTRKTKRHIPKKKKYKKVRK
jgi:P2-related tail formation protein